MRVHLVNPNDLSLGVVSSRHGGCMPWLVPHRLPIRAPHYQR